MKKVFLIIGLLSLSFLDSEAQTYSRNYNDFDRNSPYDRMGGYHGTRGNDAKYRRDNFEKNKIDSYQRRAKIKINEGIDRGLITRREAERLWIEYRMIEKKENRYLRNGRLSPREMNELEGDLARLNRMIRKEKSDWNRSRSF